MRLNWLLEEVEAQECRNFIQLQTTKQAAALNYLSGKQAFDHHWKQLSDLSKHWTALSFPWLSMDNRQDNKQLMKRWLRAHNFTDVNSPEAKAKINALSEDLRAARGEAKPQQESVSGNWCK